MTSAQKRYWRGVIAGQYFTSKNEPYKDDDFAHSSDHAPFSQGYDDGVCGEFPAKPSGSGYWPFPFHRPRVQDSEQVRRKMSDGTYEHRNRAEEDENG